MFFFLLGEGHLFWGERIGAQEMLYNFFLEPNWNVNRESFNFFF